MLQYEKEGSLEWKSRRLGQRVLSVTLDNLLCGTVYQFKIAAENSVGFGEYSPVLSTKTNGNSPETPKLTDILDGNGTMIRIDLSRWNDGGCPVKNFHIEYKTKDSVNWQRIYRQDNDTRVFTFATVTKHKYDIRIAIENDAGSVTKTFHVESVPGVFEFWKVTVIEVRKKALTVTKVLALKILFFFQSFSPITGKCWRG